MKTIKSKLYEGLSGIGGGGTGGSNDFPFNGQRAITRNTPGIKSVNVGTQTLIDFVEKVFFPEPSAAGDAITVAPATGGTNAAAPLLSGNFGNWTLLTNPTDQYFDQQLPLRFKADMLAFPARAIVYLQGQFGLLSTFTGTNILLGTLPANTCPPRRLIKYMICQNIELYLIIETTGEVKLLSKDGFNLPTMTEENVNEPYYVDCFYCPNISEMPPPVVYTSHRTGTFTRNNCGNGYTGSAVVFSNDYTSTVSQAAADALANNNFAADGQAFANDSANGATCTVIVVPPTTYTAHRTGSFTRNNCGAGSTGTAITFTYDYTSTVSQQDADNLADANFPTDGQAFANNPVNGATCSVPNFTANRSASFARNNCGVGYTGSAITVTRAYTSGASQQDAEDYADTQFPIDGQNAANDESTGGTCVLNTSEPNVFINNNSDNITLVHVWANSFSDMASGVVPGGNVQVVLEGGTYTINLKTSGDGNRKATVNGEEQTSSEVGAAFVFLNVTTPIYISLEDI